MSEPLFYIYNQSIAERHKFSCGQFVGEKEPQILIKYEMFTTQSPRLRADRETFRSLDLKAARLLNLE